MAGPVRIERTRGAIKARSGLEHHLARASGRAAPGRARRVRRRRSRPGRVLATVLAGPSSASRSRARRNWHLTLDDGGQRARPCASWLPPARHLAHDGGQGREGSARPVIVKSARCRHPRRYVLGHPGCTGLGQAPGVCRRHLSAPPAGGLRPLPHRPGPPQRLCRSRDRGGRGASAGLRAARTGGLPPLRPLGARLPARALRALRR
jgi:hypothetical protein